MKEYSIGSHYSRRSIQLIVCSLYISLHYCHLYRLMLVQLTTFFWKKAALLEQLWYHQVAYRPELMKFNKYGIKPHDISLVTCFKLSGYVKITMVWLTIWVKTAMQLGIFINWGQVSQTIKFTFLEYFFSILCSCSLLHFISPSHSSHKILILKNTLEISPFPSPPAVFFLRCLRVSLLRTCWKPQRLMARGLLNKMCQS